jgi:diaminopimelate epimerase
VVRSSAASDVYKRQLHTKGKLPATWIINPPGCRLEVSIDGHSNATLTGPAVLIRDVDISGFLLE